MSKNTKTYTIEIYELDIKCKQGDLKQARIACINHIDDTTTFKWANGGKSIEDVILELIDKPHWSHRRSFE